MNEQISNDRPRMQVDGLFQYLEGLVLGIGLGMVLAVEFVPEDGRKVFDTRFWMVAFGCTCLGPFVFRLTNWLRRKLSERRSG